MAGEKLSEAIFNLIEGKAIPSGKLPITLPNKDNEVEMTEYQYPGINDVSHYTEKLLVGYRWYDHHQVEPKYPFGHGLSYTTFDYDADSLDIKDRKVSIKVKNTGNFKGKEVVQLYIGFPKEAGEPPKQLKGFKKIELDINEEAEVSFDIRDRDLSIWDVDTHAWAE